jgi:hypothetical protein
MPVREKGRRSPGSQPARPSHVPSHPQTAAKVRGFSPIASGFTAETDWLLEQTGFELTVPPRRELSSRAYPISVGLGQAAKTDKVVSGTEPTLDDLGVQPRRLEGFLAVFNDK